MLLNRSSLVVIGTCIAASSAAAQSGKPIFITDDRQMAAFIDGAACSETVRSVFKGKTVSAFHLQEPVAARLMNNVVTLLRSQCPQLSHVSAKGVVEEDIVYSGLAEKSTDWRVVELGAGNFGGTEEAGKKSTFAGRGDFLPYDQLIGAIGGDTALCSDLSSDSCTSVTTLGSPTAASANVEAVSLLQDGATAVISFPAQAKEGFLCSNTKDASIAVSGGDMSAEGRREMEQLLLDRWLNSGDEVCVGYAGTAGGQYSSISFDGDGEQLTSEVTVTPFASSPGLRIES